MKGNKANLEAAILTSMEALKDMEGIVNDTDGEKLDDVNDIIFKVKESYFGDLDNTIVYQIVHIYANDTPLTDQSAMKLCYQM